MFNSRIYSKEMKTIFITGASSGLGKASAKLFAAKGWNVIATMRSPTKETELGNLPNVSVLELDVSNPTQIHDVAQAVTKTGGVDVVLNNAGYALTGPLEVSTDEQVVTQISTNQIGAIFVTKAFIPHFRERKSGMFLTTTSIGGLVAFPLNAVYHATKWALEGFNESLAFELKPFNVTVKSISPGSMKSDFMGKAQMVDDEHYAESFQKMLVMFGQARLVDRNRAIVDVTSMGFTMEDRLQLVRLAEASELELAASRITDWLSPGFFHSKFLVHVGYHICFPALAQCCGVQALLASVHEGIHTPRNAGGRQANDLQSVRCARPAARELARQTGSALLEGLHRHESGSDGRGR